MYVAGRRQRNSGLPRDFPQPLQVPSIVRPAVQLGQEVAAISEQVAVSVEGREERGEGRGKTILVPTLRVGTQCIDAPRRLADYSPDLIHTTRSVANNAFPRKAWERGDFPLHLLLSPLPALPPAILRRVGRYRRTKAGTGPLARGGGPG